MLCIQYGAVFEPTSRWSSHARNALIEQTSLLETLTSNHDVGADAVARDHLFQRWPPVRVVIELAVGFALLVDIGDETKADPYEKDFGQER